MIGYWHHPVVRLSVRLCRCALWLSGLVYTAKSCTSMFLAGMFLFVPSDTFAARSAITAIAELLVTLSAVLVTVLLTQYLIRLRIVSPLFQLLRILHVIRPTLIALFNVVFCFISYSILLYFIPFCNNYFKLRPCVY